MRVVGNNPNALPSVRVGDVDYSIPTGSFSVDLPGGDVAALGCAADVHLGSTVIRAIEHAPITPPGRDPSRLVTSGSNPLMQGASINLIQPPDEHIERVAQVGFKWIRFDSLWSQTEVSDDVYDFARLDRIVGKAQTEGMGVMLILAYGHTDYNPEGVGGAPRTPFSINKFARFCEAVVGRFKGHDIVYEVWNEPNVGKFFDPDVSVEYPARDNTDEMADQYADIVKSVVPVIRARDPAAIVVGGAVAGLWQNSQAWSERVFAAELLTLLDAWSVHCYNRDQPENVINGPTNGDSSSTFVQSGISAVTASMQAVAGKTIPVWHSECGTGVNRDDQGHVIGMTDAERDTHQAAHYCRQLLVDLSSGIPFSNLYVWAEDDRLRGTYGMTDTTTGETPAVAALERLFDAVGDMVLVGRVPMSNAEDWVLQLSDGTNTLLVAWTAASDPYTINDITPHNVYLDITGTVPVQALPMEGTAVALYPMGHSLTLALTGEPQLVELTGTRTLMREAWHPDLLTDAVLRYDTHATDSLTLDGSTNAEQIDDLTGNGHHAIKTNASERVPYLAADPDANGNPSLHGTTNLGTKGVVIPPVQWTHAFFVVGYGDGTTTAFNSNPALIRGDTGYGRVVGINGSADTYDTSTTADLYVNGSDTITTTLLPLPLSVIEARAKEAPIAAQEYPLLFSTAAGNSWEGAFTGLIMINGVLSDADRDRIVGFLAHVNGTQSLLPAGHAYKVNAP